MNDKVTCSYKLILSDSALDRNYDIYCSGSPKTVQFLCKHALQHLRKDKTLPKDLMYKVYLLEGPDCSGVPSLFLEGCVKDLLEGEGFDTNAPRRNF